MKSAFNGDTFIQARVLELQVRFGLKTAIETGTYHGETAGWLANHFDYCYTIENSTVNITTAMAGKDWPNLAFIKGNSPQALKALAARISDRAFVYLDAHWHNYWPLLDELKALTAFALPPVIAIHDFEVPGTRLKFDRYNGIKLNLDYVRDSMDRIYRGTWYAWEYNDEKRATGARRGIAYFYPAQ
jgi:predicted O-methyltransferase YrrM